MQLSSSRALSPRAYLGSLPGGRDLLLHPISDCITEEVTERQETVRSRYQNPDLLSTGLTPHS